MLRKFFPAGDLAPLDTLLTVVQPPFFAQTLNGKATNQLQPLTRIVDAARPDPPARWLTERLVRRFVVNAFDSAAHDSLSTLFARWRDLGQSVDVLARQSPEFSQALPATSALQRTSVIGLEALQYVRTGTRPDSTWLLSATTDLRRFETPQGLLRVVIVPEVKKLVALLQGVVQ
jgi:hypothetical protein